MPREATVTITQPLFRGDTIANTRKAKALVEAGRGQLLATEETVLLNAVTAYMDVIRYQDAVKYQQDSVQILQQLRDNVQQRITLGELSRTDFAQTEGRLSGAMSDLTQSQNQLAASHAAFEHVIGRPAESLEESPVLPVLPENYEVAEQMALRNNPTLLYAREQAIAADYAAGAAFGALLPSLSLQGQYQRSVDQIAPGIKINALSVMAQLTIPLYQGGAEYAEIRQAREQRTQANFTTSDAEREVREELRTADESLRSAERELTILQQQVAADEVALEGVQQETRVGGRSVLDVLIAEQDLVNARLTLVGTRRNIYVAAYQVLSDTGALTARALNLPVKLYDPQEHYDSDAARWIGFGD
jgi:outer membrane protein